MNWATGVLVVVALGHNGAVGLQLAEVLGASRPDGRVPVRKWRAQGRKWTGRVLVGQGEIRGLADAERVNKANKQGAFLVSP